jgi:hypothetical protein
LTRDGRGRARGHGVQQCSSHPLCSFVALRLHLEEKASGTRSFNHDTLLCFRIVGSNLNEMVVLCPGSRVQPFSYICSHSFISSSTSCHPVSLCRASISFWAWHISISRNPMLIRMVDDSPRRIGYLVASQKGAYPNDSFAVFRSFTHTLALTRI